MWVAPSQISSANSKAREPAIYSLQVSQISAWKGLITRVLPGNVGALQH